MDNNNYKILNNIAFKTQCFRKNFDLINKNENIITEYDGIISELRISERKPPLQIGEYGLSVWNIEMARMLKYSISKLVKIHKLENIYSELDIVVGEKLIKLKEYNKIVFIHGLVIRPDYRKLEITEEFVELLYRDFYNDKTIILALVKPLQNNKIDADFYFKNKNVIIKNKIGNVDDYDVIPAIKYYSLDKLIQNNDIELNEYKLFGIASRCGFNRIGESYLFQYYPEKTIERLFEKNKYLNEIEIEPE